MSPRDLVSHIAGIAGIIIIQSLLRLILRSFIIMALRSHGRNASQRRTKSRIYRGRLSQLIYITPANIRRALVFLYKFCIRRWPSAAENIRDFCSVLYPSRVERDLSPRRTPSAHRYSTTLCSLSLSRLLSVVLFLSFSLRTAGPSLSLRNFGQRRARSRNIGRDFCCALCRTYKRMRLFPGPATRATLCASRAGCDGE